ncbi:hypothetical protein GCM10010149_88720 [Nonomuraea roseoviolacea subsp. roseoviolacea]|uniref:peptidoglycan-binding domain-containing protein n=1 Tax=Nonomuraea roseoviolacea TaxID=103837 RepID=UPI0031D8D643
MTITADELIDLELSYIGYNEADHGGKTKFGIWYGDRHNNSAFDSAAWCDMFQAYCAWEVGGEEALDIVGEFAYTPHHAGWFARNGRFGSTPTKGAIGFIDWNYSKSISAIDHVVLVIGRDSKGRVVTVEGNTNDQVAKRYRDPRLFVGFGYPKYSSKVSVKVPTKGSDDQPVKKPGRPKVGTTAPKFPLASNDWFSETRHNGYSNTSDSNGVRRIQNRLKERGWKITVDGKYGGKTTQVVSAYQDEKGLDKDGAVGKYTWASLWNAPVTP